MGKMKIRQSTSRKVGRLVTLEPFSFNRFKEFYELYLRTKETWEDFLFLGFEGACDVKKFINEQYKNQLFAGFFVIENTSNKLVGFIIGEQDEEDDVVMCAFAIAQEWERNGFATEALCLFEELMRGVGCEMVLNGCYLKNEACKNLLKKSGYHYLRTVSWYVFAELDFYFKKL